MFNQVCFLEIPADNIEGLREFYSGLFGWTFEKMPGDMEFYQMNMPGGNIQGGMMPRQHPQHGPLYYVNVESLDDSVAKAQGLGASTIVPKTAVPGWGWFTVLFDPQQNPFGLWQDDRNAA